VETICREFAELRYRLLPYTYTLAWQAHTQGLPLMRPLVLNYPDDPRVWALGHQFLWGDDLLVAPVTREGATAWPVYLPAGVWYDFWTGARHEGPAGITVDAPLERLPLLVRAGAILPLGPVVQHTGERPLDEIALRIFPPERPDTASRFELYEDDGRSLGYRQGRYALTTFECAPGPEGVTVRIGESTGDRSVVPAGRRYRLELASGARPSAVMVDGLGALPRRETPDASGPGWWVDARSVTTVRLPDRPGPMVVSLRT
jgi:alpha-glucosidase (family GH31 glycosyl hydrolase)